MKRTWFTLLAGLLLAIVLAGCTSTSPAPKDEAPVPPKWDDLKAGDTVMNYELHKFNLVKEPNPHQFVTGPEKVWLDQFLAEVAGGAKYARPNWIMGGATFAITSQNTRELELRVNYPLADGNFDTIYYKFQAVNGEWKIANHAGPDKKYLPNE